MSQPNTKPEPYPSLSPIVNNVPNADCIGMFDVAETIQRLCNEGTLDLGTIAPAPKSAALPVVESCPTDRIEVKSPIALDVLSSSFLQDFIQRLSVSNSRSYGVIIASKSGRVIELAQTGWDASSIRTTGHLIGKLTRESAWQPAPRLSSDVLQVVATTENAEEPSAKPCTIEARSSIFLNQFAKALGTPLFLATVPLEKSTGFALFFCDASDCLGIKGPGEQQSDFVTSASQAWLDEEAFDSLRKQLDAWLIVHRCHWLIRLIEKVERVRARPRWWALPIAIACCAMVLPVPYYPKRECVFEPETKQFLASPVAGRIASCEVRPGDSVEKGQLLARIDDDQLRRDLATAQADFDSALKKRDAALATRAAGTAGLADIEMKQAQWRIESIEDHLRRLEIRASAPGIVVQGDWHRSIGMPVTLGQNLFEVAELESMTAEVRLKASDLGQINVGDEVHVRSDASGLSTFHGKIIRIEPRATVIDNAAVFIADVSIRDKSLQLRPGMKADAQITAGWRTVGWLLFERPYRWIANQWVW